jgi:glycosyltransferase involved in cell wall biosynthesis
VRVVIDYRPALRNATGVGEYVRRLAASLFRRRQGDNASTLQITLFSSSWKDRLELPADLRGVDYADARLPVGLLNAAWHRLEWPSIEWLTGKSFDVTHSLHPLLMPSRRAARVITIHDLDFLTHPERTRAEIRRDYPALVRPHAARADRIIVPSRFTAGEVERRLGVGAERVSVSPPGAPDWAPRRKTPCDGYILFVGTLEPRKNVGVLLDAYERLVMASGRAVPELVLAGAALPETQSWLDRIARPPLNGRVRHLGYVESSGRRQLYQDARVLVQPSLEEGFGLPVLEAMTSGVPVVASDRGALPEVLGDAGLLVNPADAEAMAAAIERMLRDEIFASACASKGVLRSGQFSWDRTAERVVEAYALAIQHRTARSGRP